MSFEESLVKKKINKGLTYLIIWGVLIISILSYLGVYHNISPKSHLLDLIIGYFFPIIGIPFFIKGIITLAKRKKLTNKERIQKNDIEKDEKIKGLEKRLEKVEEEKSKSDDNPENS